MVNVSLKNSLVNATIQTYVPTPGKLSTRTIISVLAVVCYTVGVVGNSLVLFLEWKKYRGSSGEVRLFERPLTMYFVNSLAVTDVCNSLLNIPLFVINMFEEFLVYRVGCLAYSATLFTFPAVTILNLLVISVERYLALFYPCHAPTRRQSKKLVTGAWIVGFVVGILTTLTMDVVKFDINELQFALICTYNKRVPWKNGLYTAIAILMFLLPTIVMSYTASMITRFLRKRKRRVIPGSIKETKKRTSFQGTKLLMNVIFAFAIPYSLFFVYNIIKTFAKVELNFQDDYTIRVVSALTALSNSAINPLIYVYNSRQIRREILSLFQQ